MQLIRVLLVIVAVAVLLSGISIFLGSTKQEKSNGGRFLIATLGAAIWSLAIMIFIKMPNASEAFSHLIVTCIIAGVTLCDVGLLAYLGWQQKGGKIATIIFSAIGAILVTLLAYDSSLFYTSIDVNQEYTHLFVNKSWYYYTIIAYFFLISIVFSNYLQKQIKKTTNKGQKRGLQIFYGGLSIGGILALIFNLILISSHPHLTWIGPMATAISVLTFYYSAVKFRIISMSSRWTEVLSYIVIIATAIVVYLLAFYIVFTALFGIANPTNEVLMLNLIMGLFLLLLMPTITELANFMRASFYTDRIELGYIIKKLEVIKKDSYDPKDIARFLADTMHYSYVALTVKDHFYLSDSSRFTTEEVNQLAKLKAENGAWIVADELKEIDSASQHNISRIGILRNRNGKEIGKIIFGKKVTAGAITRRDLVKHEAIIGIISCIVEENNR